MKKVAILAMAAFLALAISGGGIYAQGMANQVQVTLSPENNSGQSGTATITEENGQLHVVIQLSNGSSTAQPAHIHKGTCANLDPVPAFPLTSVVDGKSDTMLNLTMATLEQGTYAINVHKSAAEVSTYVACGDIVNMMMGGAAGGTGTTTGSTSGGTTSGGTSTSTGSESTPGMPSTGAGDTTLPILALVLLALVVTGLGFRLAQRKV